jgi:tetratricopeptide (TPR) repeat protein
MKNRHFHRKDQVADDRGRRQNKLAAAHGAKVGVQWIGALSAPVRPISSHFARTQVPGFPLKNVLAIVSLSALLAGCAGFPRQSPQQAAPAREDSAPPIVAEADSDITAAADARSDAPEPVDPTLPTVNLTEELMYKLLASEIAYQRGQWQSAYVTLMSAAQQTRDPRLARRAAEIALSVKQSGEALSAIRLWRELAPQSEEATQYLLGFIVVGDHLEEARPILDQRLKEARPATRGLMMFQMQRMLTRAKDKAAAFAMLEELVAPYKDTTDAHLALAHAAFSNNDGARARSEATVALNLKPDSELAVLTLAQVTPDKNEAMKALDRFIAVHPASRDVRVAYARMLVEQKQYDKARAEFDAVLKLRPDDLGSLYALGILSTQINDNKAAEKYLTSYLDILARHPDDERDPTQAYLVLAQIAEERKDSEGALKWLSQIESGDVWLGAQIKRAQIIAKRGDMAGARKLLDELKPDNERDQAQLVIAEAQLLRDGNRPDEAMTVLQNGLKRYPGNTDLLYDFAMVAEKADKLDVMETTLRKIIELAPNNQHAYNALGYSLAERNIRLPEAQVLVEKALALAPEDPFIMDSMGWVFFRQGKLKEAEDLLRRAYDMRSDPEIATHLGEVLWVKGQHDDAQKLWRDASKKDPQNDTLKSTLARLHVKL